MAMKTVIPLHKQGEGTRRGVRAENVAVWIQMKESNVVVKPEKCMEIISREKSALPTTTTSEQFVCRGKY